jgi:hypothetical protein
MAEKRGIIEGRAMGLHRLHILVGIGAKDMPDGVHHIMDMDVFDFIRGHFRTMEVGQELIVILTVGGFGVEHNPVTVEDDELEHRNSGDRRTGWQEIRRVSVFEENLL